MQRTPSLPPAARAPASGGACVPSPIDYALPALFAAAHATHASPAAMVQVGVAGLVGSGRSNVAETLFGVTPATSGRIAVHGREMTIANPGVASITAVLHPAATDYLYFVARADGSGGHNFSANLAAHEANVVQYRRATADRH